MLPLVLLLAACGAPAGADAPAPVAVGDTSGDDDAAYEESVPAAAPAPDGDVAIGVDAPPHVAAPPGNASRTASGLASLVVRPGHGLEHPGPDARVTVHYSGWTTDGEMFDSSVTRGQPATFPLSAVIAGWTEGVQLMVAGEVRRLWIPEDLAYGGRPGRPQGMLVFDIQLLEIVAPPPIPADVAAPPAHAERTASGLSSVVLAPGRGERHPTATSQVEVHYTGWTTDGRMFDSSTQRGVPARFPLDRVIPGWTEALQLMVEGERRRIWIPAGLAYGDPPRPGAPAGMLVFEIELLRILP